LRNYTQYGQSGIAVSDWFPNVGSCVDDIAFIRSMYTQEVNHFPAVIEMVTDIVADSSITRVSAPGSIMP
jgi:hypothetical protein